jgi:hypothetical protein
VPKSREFNGGVGARGARTSGNSIHMRAPHGYAHREETS